MGGFVPSVTGKVGEGRFRCCVAGIILTLLAAFILLVVDSFCKSGLWACGLLLGVVSVLAMPILMDDIVLPPICFELSTTGLQVSSIHGTCLCARRVQHWAAADLHSVGVYKQIDYFRYVHMLTTA